MKRLVLAVVLSGVVFAAAAQASVAEPTAPVPDAAAVSAEAPVTTGDESAAASARPTASNCIQQTGSRIRVKNQAGKCNGAPGSAYTRDDIRGTARGDLGEALRTLDTSIF